MHSKSLWRRLKRSLGLYPPHPLWNALPIVQLSSVPILEMWPPERDTIMYPPVQIIPGVVDQSWIGTWEAGQGVCKGQRANSSLPYRRYADIVLLEEKIVSNILIDWHGMCVKAFIHIALACK